jgi:hypothetical protein
MKDKNPFHLGEEDSEDLSNESDTDDEADKEFSYHGSIADEYDEDDIDEAALEK